MKLLWCPKCNDVIRLQYFIRSCECGRVSGKYLNNVEAVSNGKGVSIGIGNAHISMAAMSLGSKKETKDQQHYIEGKEYQVKCWVRPNEGPGNPHSIVGEVRNDKLQKHIDFLTEFLANEDEAKADLALLERTDPELIQKLKKYFRTWQEDVV